MAVAFHDIKTEQEYVEFCESEIAKARERAERGWLWIRDNYPSVKLDADTLKITSACGCALHQLACQVFPEKVEQDAWREGYFAANSEIGFNRDFVNSHGFDVVDDLLYLPELRCRPSTGGDWGDVCRDYRKRYGEALQDAWVNIIRSKTVAETVKPAELVSAP